MSSKCLIPGAMRARYAAVSGSTVNTSSSARAFAARSILPARKQGVRDALGRGPRMAEERVALITGCGRRNGIGAACARALAATGCAVAVTDVARTGVPNTSERLEDIDRSWSLDDLVRELVDGGRRALPVLGDVSR